MSLFIVDVHFTLAAKRDNKATHVLLGKLSLVGSVSDDEIISGHAINLLLSVLLEDLPTTELFHICGRHCLILQKLHLLLELLLREGLCILLETFL